MNKLSLSLVAIAMMSSAAMADISSKSFDGSAKLFYSTSDANDGDFFNKGQSFGNVAVELGGAASVGGCDTCVTLNYGVTGVSTMGLEDTLVRNTWIGQSTSATGPAKPFAGANINDGVWIDTLNLVFHPLNGISNTTMVVGRQEHSNPMVFTEKWSIAKNTFDGATVVNNDIQDTTLAAAWVGRSNSRDVVDQLTDTTIGSRLGAAAVVDSDGISDNAYNRFLTDEGAYAFGAVTKLIPMVTAQAWYYIAPAVANVAWVQADGEYAGFGLGGQYVYNDPQAKLGNGDSGSAFAAKIGYNYEGIGLSAAYSSADEDLATAANLAGTQSKLYTEAWWNYGFVSKPDTDSFNVTATYSAADIADLGVYYTNADNGAANDAGDLSEIAVTAGKDLGNLNLTLAYINAEIDGADAVNDIQVYATYKF